MAEVNKLSSAEQDVLGEIANISMGSSATSLAQLLKQDVSITTPQVRVTDFEELFGSFSVPYIAIQVIYTSGIQGFNLLVINLDDAKTILKMLLGSRVGDNAEFDEMETSALSEIMNQMMGAGATALNQVYRNPIAISTPELQLIDISSMPGARPSLNADEPLVAVAFRFKIGTVVDSQVLQVIPLSSARQQAAMMLENTQSAGKADKIVSAIEKEAPSMNIVSQAQPESQKVRVEKAEFPLIEKGKFVNNPRKIEMLMDIPLDASVVLGTVSRTINQILSLSEGSVVELDKLVEEPVDLYVNGVPVARGEIVVINENFGLRITEIISSAQRLETLSSLRKM